MLEQHVRGSKYCHLQMYVCNWGCECTKVIMFVSCLCAQDFTTYDGCVTRQMFWSRRKRLDRAQPQWVQAKTFRRARTHRMHVKFCVCMCVCHVSIVNILVGKEQDSGVTKTKIQKHTSVPSKRGVEKSRTNFDWFSDCLLCV